jgi:uncharacterized RDD family membrane protein YckC
MPGEPTDKAPPDPVEGPLDPAPGSLERTSTQPQSANGTVGGLIDATGRALAPFARLGWRGARGVGRRLGINDAVSRRVDRALDSETAERATERVLESDSAKRVWGKVLESEEAQKLVERVAEAPEVRSAITSQGVGLLEDVRRTARRAARRLDDGLERAVKRLLRRRPRTERPIYAGGATRALALGLDAAILSGVLLLISTLLAVLADAVFSIQGNGTAVTIAFGAIAWWTAAAIYLGAFWTLAERTPGMTFFALRILTESGERVLPRQDFRRLVGFILALIPFGLGFLGVLTEERRRGWQDRFAGTVVLYSDPELDSELPGYRAPDEHRRR